MKHAWNEPSCGIQPTGSQREETISYWDTDDSKTNFDGDNGDVIDPDDDGYYALPASSEDDADHNIEDEFNDTDDEAEQVEVNGNAIEIPQLISGELYEYPSEDDELEEEAEFNDDETEFDDGAQNLSGQNDAKVEENPKLILSNA